MLTLPVEAGGGTASRLTRILVIGRSETVLSQLVTILRDRGYAAGATNDFGRALELFDAGQLDLVVFGGMVPPDTKEHLRQEMSARNPAAAFVQGYAGIPGLIAEQVEAALSHGAPEVAAVTYDARSRSIGISLDVPQDVTVTAWWHTSFVPPEPASTARVMADGELPAGVHTIAIPDEVPARASFATVSAGRAACAFIVGPMPSGTTMAAVPAAAPDRLGTS
jgi:CheY-like chemotaxis protein